MAELCYTHHKYKDDAGNCAECDKLVEESKVRPKGVYYFKQFTPYFNVGLGQRVESRKHFKGLLKAKGLTECGDANLRSNKRGTYGIA